ncbi:MAG TPA: hypothetical protein VM348_11835 [Brevundimonas sp.]|nr:hypothetical protein [Brevundimonas sp.]
MAAEAAGRAYITKNETLKAHLNDNAQAWVYLGNLADKQDALVLKYLS